MFENRSSFIERGGHCSVFGPPSFNLAEKIIFFILNHLTNLFGLFGNGLVIYVVYKYPRLRKRSIYFLLCLSFTDFIISIFVQPIATTLVILSQKSDKLCWLSLLMTYSAATMCGTSAAMLTLISYDRYMHLSKLNNYNLHMTTKKIKGMLIVCWLYSPIIGTFMFSKKTSFMFYILVVFTSALLFTITTICYYKSWKIVKLKLIKDKSTSTDSMNSHNINKHWKVAKSMLLVIICYLIAWSPLTLFTLVQEICSFSSYDISRYELTYKLLYFSLWCGFSNSCVNPFIYYWKNRELREALQSIFKSYKTHTAEANKNRLNLDATASSTS